MKLRLVALGFVCGMATTLTTNQVLSGGGGDEKSDHDRMMERWQEYALPGEHHKILEKFEGEWEATSKHWFKGPDAEPSVNTFTMSSRLIFGGRFLETRMAGEINIDNNGESMTYPVQAIGYTGYDNFKEKYVGVWLDSHSTAIYYCEGLPDKTGSAIIYVAAWDDWATGERDKPIKLVTRFVDDDTYIDEIYDLHEDAIAMQSTCKRKGE